MDHTRFERARIIGARALQVSMGAPMLLDLPDGAINPVKIAMHEYKEGLIPITIRAQSAGN